MFTWLKTIFGSGGGKSASRGSASQFLDTGFHGDKYLLQLVDALANRNTVLIETGTNVGSTLAYFAKKYPSIRCFSCEPDDSAYSLACENAGGLENVSLFKGTSQQFMENLLTNENRVFSEQCMFWLDAHGYGFEWPLKAEIEFITGHFNSGYILIDDFKVPGREEFVYDQYLEHVCSYEYVKDSLNPDQTYQLYYPSYRDKTSQHHPLCGWGLLIFGHEDFSVPDMLIDKMERKL